MGEARQHGTPYYLPDGAEPGAARRMEQVPYARGKAKDGTKNERWVQELIHRHPELLPIDEIEPAYHPVIPVCMELRTARGGSIDNVFITPNGNLIFAETKLYRNPEARREVVAQVMDYAESLTGWTFQEFEDAAGQNLFELVADKVADKKELNEERFFDSVARNLRTGRSLFLIVGDGIREEAETLVRHMQAHAGLEFALALVELACFPLPGGGGMIIHPRTIVRTTNIERGIVRVKDGRAVVSAPDERPEKTSSGAKTKARSLSAGEFYEQLADVDPALPARLEAFAERLEAFGVKIKFNSGFTFIWEGFGGKWVNLGEIYPDGKFWSDHTVVPRMQKYGVSEHAKEYLEEIARPVGGELVKSGDGLRIVVREKSPPMVADMLDHADAWAAAVEKLTAALASKFEDS